MSRERILITGGAGFIGSHLADRLLETGHEVRLLDALLPQVHGSWPPGYLDPRAELRVGDVRDASAVREALQGSDVLVHFAAAVGVGQSMYEVSHYCSVNVMGTANLLEVLVRDRPRLKRLVVASSMSIYGEGRYECPGCGPRDPGPRPLAQMRAGDWAMRCPSCAAAMEPRPTPEAKPLLPRSVYATNKRDQEEMVLTIGRSLGIPSVALRFFNVYGDRQALSNPYTGVAAIFSSALINRQPPLVFEDGQQQRDFVHVSDIAEACRLAIERTDVQDVALNIGTGQPTSLLRLLGLLQGQLPEAAGVAPRVVGRFREGDIRACYADISLARELLGFQPRVSVEDGAAELARWARAQSSEDASSRALAELERHGLVR